MHVLMLHRKLLVVFRKTCIMAMLLIASQCCAVQACEQANIYVYICTHDMYAPGAVVAHLERLSTQAMSVGSSSTFFQRPTRRCAASTTSSWLPRTARKPSRIASFRTSALFGPLFTRSPASTTLSLPRLYAHFFSSSCSWYQVQQFVLIGVISIGIFI
jgi:hypothetical protein